MQWLNKIIALVLPFMPKKFIWLFSKRYIAGIDLSSAINASRQLNDQQVMVTLDILGEFIHTLDEAECNRNAYLNLIDAVEKEYINGNYSLKPTMFGLLIDKTVCFEHIRSIVQKAASYNNFIRIDMEDSECTDDTISIYRQLKAEFPNNVGLVVQAYLMRTAVDLQNMLDLHSVHQPLNFRLCKGIYVESANIAFKNHDEINRHFLNNLEFMFKNGIYAAIATHDKALVDGAYQLIEKYKVNPKNYEFQMLYGVTPELRKSIVDAGHRMRVYVPFGEHWFAYSTRRLKENPKMAGLIIKALFIRG